MTIGLGIDTGGTYTDSVLIDCSSGSVIAKSKVLTDKSNLLWSIKEGIKSLGSDYKRANFITLSTTLATNAIVEGQGAEVGAIIVVPEPDEIDWPLPPAKLKIVQGGHDVRGMPYTNLDIEGIRKAALDFKGHVEAIAISAYFSIRNPEHEIRAKSILTQYIDVPIVCGHELSSSLGFRERTTTAILNARITPIVKNFLAAVRKALQELKIDVPLMIVKSDGSLMFEEDAMLMPIKTILSGPAASVQGALYLAGLEKGIVVDIGGTTTDIAIVKGNSPVINEEGASVGGWRTHVKGIDINTFGLGGDSHIKVEKDASLRIGPRRVLPLALLAQRFSIVNDELKTILKESKHKTYPSTPTDFLYLIKKDANFTDEEKVLVNILQQRPLSIVKLAQILNTHPVLIPTERLENIGVIGRAGLTPTDILNTTGEFSVGDTLASRLGVEIMSHHLKIEENAFIKKVKSYITNTLTKQILDKVIQESLNLNECPSCKIYDNLISQAIGLNTIDMLDVSFSLKYPLVGIGAPVNVFLQNVAKCISAELIVPEHAEVGNAIGTVVGNIIETAEIIIRKIDDGEKGCYVMFSPWERKTFENIEDAKQYAIQLGVEKLKKSYYDENSFQPIISISDDYSYDELKLSISSVRKPWWYGK
ncbi:MAG: hydantoinase/oxoprolinase family protein [Thermacetogeniaceae bacterium]